MDSETKQPPSGTRIDTTPGMSILNVVTVILLVLIALGFLTMPRVNYGLLASRIASVEVKTAVLEDGFAKVNLLAGPHEGIRASVVGKLDWIAEQLKKNQEDQLSFLDHLADLSTKVDDVESKTRADATLAEFSKGDGQAQPARRFADEALQKMSGRDYSSEPFEVFLSDLTSLGLWQEAAKRPPPTGDANYGSDRLRRSYAEYQSCLSLVRERQTLLIERLVGEETKNGNFVDVHPDGRVVERNPELKRPPVEGLKGGGTVHVKTLEGGVRREFRFPSKENDEFSVLFAMRENALRSLLLMVGTYAQR